MNPGNRRQVYQSLGFTLSAIETPVWAGLMATFVRNRGFSVRVLDANAENISPEEAAERITEMDPVLTAVVVYGHQPSASTQIMPAAGAICTAVKQRAPDLKTLLVGGHVAALPERTLREEDADFVAGGEGPYTILELLQALKSGQPDYSKVRGLWYWDGKKPRSTPPAPLVKDLDREMAGIAWDLLPMDKYRAHNWHCFRDLQRQPYASLYTTLGCPYHCGFCLLEGTVVITARGRNRKIEDLKIGDKLMAWDERGGCLAETEIIAMGKRLVNKILRVEVSSGQEIYVTHEHPVFTPKGWVEAGELKPGDGVLLMDRDDKARFLRSKYAPTRQPEVKALLSERWKNGGRPATTPETCAKIQAAMQKRGVREILSNVMKERWCAGRAPSISEEGRRRISERMKANNPMKREEVRSKVSVTIQEKYGGLLSEKMRRFHQEGKIPHVSPPDEVRLKLSERMKHNNPMKNEIVAKKVGETLKKKIESGEYVPFTRTDRGKEVIAEAARRRALSEDNPLRGEKNPFWRGGIPREYPPSYTASLKRCIKGRDGYACQNCGSEEKLTVHHIDNDKSNNEPCNLICLCMSCNQKARFNREIWKEHYRKMMAAEGNCPHYEKVAEIEELEDEFKVYNFQCSPHDNYFAEFICVHNCCIQAPFKSGEKVLGYKESVNSYRFWSPQSVIAQIDKLVNEYGVRNIKIADEMFVLNPRHVIGICDLIIERGYNLNIWAYGRVDTVREGMVDKLKWAGFNWLAFGIEAASERVRDDVDKGFEQDEIFRTIEKVRAAGINVIANYIFGLPEDDLETMQATLNLALELNCEFANFYVAMSYPGSQLYNIAVKEGWPLPEKWSGYSQHAIDTLPLPTKYVSGAEVLRFRDHAFQVYFNSPKYLDMITRKFGPETAQHIREMTSDKLVRKYA